MQIGVTPWNFSSLDAGSLAGQAARAEALGYESFWLPESHFNANAIPDPLMLLAAVAASTRSIRLATTSYLLPVRNPLMAAEQVAVLDRLSGGRVILGIGRGYAAAMLHAFDVLPGEKRRLFEQSLETMKQAWSGAPVPVGEAGGQTIVLNPLPVQRPHPPLWVAAFGPKALAQAGRLGLPYLASPMETLETLEANYARHAAAAAEAGHTAIRTVPVMRTVFLTRSAARAARLRERIHAEAKRSGRLREGAAVEEWAIIGDRSLVRDRIQEYREKLAVSHLIVTRLRVGGMEESELEASVAGLAEVIH